MRFIKKIKEELEGELEDLEKENDKLTKQIYPDDFIAWWIVVG